MRFSGTDREVIGIILLENPPHHFDIFRGISPVAFGFQVSKVELVLSTGFDVGNGASDLSGHEGFTSTRGLVIEKNPVAAEDTVRVAIDSGY